MQTVYITPFRVAKHELHKSLRLSLKLYPHNEIYQGLVDQRIACRKQMVSTIGSTLLLGFLISNNEYRENFDIAHLGLPIQIPSYIFIFFAFFTFMGAIIGVLNFIQIDAFFNHFVLKYYKSKSPLAFSAFSDSNAVFSIGMQPQYEFYESKRAHKLSTFIGAFFLLFPILAFFLLSGVVILRAAYLNVAIQNVWSFEAFCLFAAIGVVIYSVLQTFVMFVPFEFSKNSSSIRWGFLYSIWRRCGTKSANHANWLRS